MKNKNNNNRSWDAQTDDKIQLDWVTSCLRKEGIGNEMVMDAGAGSGNLTKILADKLAEGHT